MLSARRIKYPLIFGLFLLAAVCMLPASFAGEENVLKNSNFEDPILLNYWSASGGTLVDDVGGNYLKYTGGGTLTQIIDHPGLSTDVGSEIRQLNFYSSIQDATISVKVSNPDSEVLVEEDFNPGDGTTGVAVPSGAKVKKGGTFQIEINPLPGSPEVILDDVQLYVYIGQQPTNTPTPEETPTPTETPTETPTGPTPTETSNGTQTPVDTPTETVTPTPTPQKVTSIQVSANPNYLMGSSKDFEKPSFKSRIQMRAIRANGSAETDAQAGQFTASVISGSGIVGAPYKHPSVKGAFLADFIPGAQGRSVIEVTYSDANTSTGDNIRATVGILVDVVESPAGVSIAPQKKNVLYQRRK